MNSAQNARVGALMKAQAGQVTMRQATKAGLSASQVHHEVHSGRWSRVGRGVYRVTGSTPSWEQRAWAACLEAGGWASHRTAGWLWGLDGVGRAAPRDIEVLVTYGNKRQARDALVRRSRTLLPSHVVNKPGVPRTSLARTLIDLSEVLDANALEAAFDSAGRQVSNLRGWLRKLLEPMPLRGHQGIGNLAALLDERDLAVDSALEVKLRRLLKAARVPLPQAGVDVLEDGEHIAKIDFAWPKNKPRVALMAHGARWHSNTWRWKRDMQQASRLAGLGWRVIQCTSDDVTKRPEELLRNIRRALEGFEASAVHEGVVQH